MEDLEKVKKIESKNSQASDFPLLIDAIRAYKDIAKDIDQGRGVSLVDAELEGVPVFVLAGQHIFPKSVGDKTMAHIVKGWEGGISGWSGDYVKMILNSPLKDKLIAKYGEQVLNHLHPEDAIWGKELSKLGI